MHHGSKSPESTHTRRRATVRGSAVILAAMLLLAGGGAAVAQPGPTPPVPPATVSADASTQGAVVPDGKTSGERATARQAVGRDGATMQTNAAQKMVRAGLPGPAPEPAARMAREAIPAAPQTGPSSGTAPLSRSVPGVLPAATWNPGFGVPGQDVSYYQGSVNWAAQYSAGSRFAYVKATEGSYYTNGYFGSQYTGSAQQGMIRGAYHFAIPSFSSGAAQAQYFAANGGGWSSDGITLPPVLDIEYNPYVGRTDVGFNSGDICYSLAGAPMVKWISDFGNTMLQLTGRYPVVYTTTDWWTRCTGNSSAFSSYPLWIAAYPSSPSTTPGTLPASWQQYSIWQYTDSGPFAGDSDIWNGDYTGLKRFSTVSDAATAIATEAAQNSWLGGAKTGVNCGLTAGGCYQIYANGTIHWQASAGAHATKDPIRATWAAQSYENGPLGYPSTDQACGLVNGGCYQIFQGGSVHWSAATGANLTAWGAIRNAWGVQGYENGSLGYPTSNGETCGQPNGGCYQLFQGGAINYTASTGAHITRGAIRGTWGAQGYENGSLGYPTTDETCGLLNGGCYQLFQGGSIHWSPSSGAKLTTWGAIRNAWGAQGYENGRLGYPTSNGESCGLINSGCYQMFQGGAINYSPATGAHVSPFGAIRTTWGSLGFERGALGYPTTDEICSVSTSCYQSFQHGTISWTSAGGTSVSYS
ncbi:MULTISPECIES: GH25 family lysozyme [Arthrobacter]|uniref:Lysozyme n=2 Tax=Arthrobacter TaxID=1663 RepID=A0ABU9KJL0_9MICC|nr:GH25 family lysozyme [Arthrobacter sp. YJM1]MDP5227256.1 GH25 family lysozyme [Arthrobacter sp. YJM1]